MRALKFLSLAGCLFLVASESSAYESECRTDASLFGGRFNENAYRQSTCEGEAVELCAQGLEYSRGAMFGEHSWLVRQAARQARVLPLFSDENTFNYYTLNRNVPGSGANDIPTTACVEPVRHSAADMIIRGSCTPGDNTCRERKLTLAELAHVPDASHTLSDYVLGNEHCMVENLPNGALPDIQRCHTFAPHMGAVNSTHFLPQARSMYRLYHGLAKDVATRCAAKKVALEAATNQALYDDDSGRQLILQSCEKEALALEAVAQHFLSDAWSTGHMWQRWGTPLYPDTRDGQLDYITTALFAGLIHGWRAVARANIPDDAGGESTFFTHDQMCMAGPFDQDDQDEDYIEWRNPGEAALPGGGDLYLHDCLAKEKNADWAVATTAGRMAVQNKRMLTCLTLGIADIYEAGPKTLGDVEIQVPALDDSIGVAATDPTNIDRCWNQLVTNRSMQLGLRIGRVPLDAPVIGGLVPYALPTAGALAAGWGLTEEGVLTELRHASARLRRSAQRVANRAARLSRDPDGTAVASMNDSMTDSFMRLPRNSTSTDLIDNDQVPYFEPHSSQSFGLFASPDPCSSAADCASVPGSYCGAAADGQDRRCMHPEAALVRAFPDGEIDTICRQSFYTEVDESIQSCTASGGGIACQACTELVRPLIRNGCPPALAQDERYTEHVYTPGIGNIDNRSQCDVMGATAPYSFHIPFDVVEAQTVNELALAICESGELAGNVVEVMGDPIFDDDFARCGLGIIEEFQGSGVRSMAVFNGDLYAAGDFRKAGGTYTNDIARYDGNRWHAVGFGNTSTANGFDSWIWKLEPAPNNGGVYAAGAFTEMDGVAAEGIALWDGTTWSPLGSGPNGLVRDILVDGSFVYVAGSRTNAQLGEEGFVAYFDGTSWTDLGVFGCENQPICSQPVVDGIEVFNGQIVAGGRFTSADGIAVNHIAIYDGVVWTRPTYESPNAAGAIPLRLNEKVTSLAKDAAGNLYASGFFYEAGDCFSDCTCDGEGRPFNCQKNFAGVLRLDAAGADQLSSMGNGGLDEYTLSIDVIAGTVYATVLGLGFDAPIFYSYNGANQTWNAVNGAAAANGNESYVTSFAHDGTNLFVGGNFINMGATQVNNVARLNGNVWEPLAWVP